MSYTVKMYAHAPNKMAIALFNFTGASNIKVALFSTYSASANDPSQSFIIQVVEAV